MPDTSARLDLPNIQGGQAQKHITHNEALERLDLLVHLAVEDFGAETPPATDPDEGQVWALGPAPTGAWEGQGGTLAAWSNGGWLFVEPGTGWRAARGSELRVRDGTAWVLPDLPDLVNLPGVGIGAAHDPVNRLTVASEATLLNHAGAGHQLKLNKAATGDTASILFQTGFSGRAEFGTAGADDFSMKVSPDGSAWQTVLTLFAATGRARFAQPVEMASGSGVAPGLAFSDEPATGVFRPAAQALAVAVNGSERLRATAAGVQVTGALTGTAVTQSAIDTTAGRLLKVGDFGVGATSVSTISNLESELVSGVYRHLSAAGSGSPDAPGWWASVQVFSGGAGNGQGFLYLRYSATAPRCWIGRRSSVSGPITWHLWHNNSTVLGTVGETGGVPTGALFEQGSNGNGRYVRLADGTQVCWHIASVTGAITNTMDGGFRSTGSAWTYPAAFVAAPSVVALADNLSGTGAGVASRNATSVNWFVTAGTSVAASATRIVNLAAFGRWF